MARLSSTKMVKSNELLCSKDIRSGSAAPFNGGRVAVIALFLPNITKITYCIKFCYLKFFNVCFFNIKPLPNITKIMNDNHPPAAQRSGWATPLSHVTPLWGNVGWGALLPQLKEVTQTLLWVVGGGPSMRILVMLWRVAMPTKILHGIKVSITMFFNICFS